jgi:hypothetical protein
MSFKLLDVLPADEDGVGDDAASVASDSSIKEFVIVMAPRVTGLCPCGTDRTSASCASVTPAACARSKHLANGSPKVLLRKERLGVRDHIPAGGPQFEPRPAARRRHVQ